jgi:hypothetical protein
VLRFLRLGTSLVDGHAEFSQQLADGWIIDLVGIDPCP